jgi:hypothetical protein
MINPVPVDIVKKQMYNNSMRSVSPPPMSPERKPQSILKQTSTILSRSLSGISAIEF